MVWGFFGNFTTKVAVDVAKDVKQLLNLKPTKREDLNEFHVA